MQSCKSGAKLCKVGIYCFSIFGAGGDCNEASWEQDWKIVGNIFQLAIISAENYLIAGLNIFRFLLTRHTIKQKELSECLILPSFTLLLCAAPGFTLA